MSKYRNKRVVIDDQWFDSMREAERYCELRLMEKAGVIKNLKRQVPFTIVPETVSPSGKKNRASKYIADFVYLDEKGNQIVEDAKGVRTQIYNLKKKIMLWLYGIEVKET